MRVDIVTTESEFAALRDGWNAMAQRAPTRSVFLTHEWFTATWAWRRHDSALRLLVARADDRIVAILPLIASASSRRPRKWTLLTVPDTQHCDMVAEPGALESAASAFAVALARNREWDILRFDYLDPRGAIATHLLAQLQERSIPCILEKRGRNLYIPLRGDWARYWDSRSRSLKKASNLAANRFEKAGMVRIDRLGPASPGEAECQRMIDAAIEVSRRSWKRRTGNSLDHPGPSEFIRVLSSVALRERWLSLWIAYLDDRPVAMEYQLVYGGDVHALRSDFDTELAHDSPGSYLFRHLIEALFGQGLNCYLMGPGENTYKTRWTDEGRPMASVAAYNHTIAGTLAHWINTRAKPMLRPVRDRMVGYTHRVESTTLQGGMTQPSKPTTQQRDPTSRQGRSPMQQGKPTSQRATMTVQQEKDSPDGDPR